MPTEPQHARASKLWLDGCAVHRSLAPLPSPSGLLADHGPAGKLLVVCVHGIVREVRAVAVSLEHCGDEWSFTLGVINDLPVLFLV